VNPQASNGSGSAFVGVCAGRSSNSWLSVGAVRTIGSHRKGASVSVIEPRSVSGRLVVDVGVGVAGCGVSVDGGGWGGENGRCSPRAEVGVAV
jgi:hypothetical protein